MTCPICEWIDTDQFVIYQDKLVVAFLHPEPVVEGHVVVAPRQHFAIMEQVPTSVIEHMFVVSNRISVAIFEMIGAKGTNLLVNNGISAGQEFAHFTVNVIPRKENDGLNFRWAPGQVTQEEFQSIMEKVKDKCDYIGHEQVESEPEEIDQVSEISGAEDDLRLKQFERTP